VNDPPRRLRILRTAIVLTLVFNVIALLVLVRVTPVIFTVFMFLAQPLFGAALILLFGAVLAELRARQIL